MANVLVNSNSVNKQMRNKRNYGGSVINNNRDSFAIIPPQKKIIEFNTDTPTIPDYSIYADAYGQYPTIELFTYDVDNINNRIKRPEQPYFNMILAPDGINYIIGSIIFGTFGEGVQSGFITIGI